MNHTTSNKIYTEVTENKFHNASPIKEDPYIDSRMIQPSLLDPLEDKKGQSMWFSHHDLPKEESNSGEWHDHSTKGDISNEDNTSFPLSTSNLSIAASLEHQEEILVFRSEDDVEGAQVCEPVSSAQPEEIALNLGVTEAEAVGGENIQKRVKLWAKNYLESWCERTSEASFLRKSFAVLLTIFAGSLAALKIKDTEKLVPILFLVACLGLLFQIFEDTVHYYNSLRMRNNTSEKWEYLFEITDKAFLVVFLLSLYSKAVFGELVMFLTPSLFLIEIMFYVEKSSISQSDKETKVIFKAFYFIQSLLIALKINGFVDYDWKWTLFFLWIYLGAYACYALFTGVLLLSAGLASIMHVNRQTFSLLKKKIAGYAWQVPYYALNGVAFFVLIGIFQKLDAQNEEILLSSLRCAKNLSTFLLIYTFFLFPTLKRLDMASFSAFGGPSSQDVDLDLSLKNKKMFLKAQDENKTAFFLMISPTYFRKLEDNDFHEDLENPQQEQDITQSCYICENNVSNAILAGCGHGGICCDCVVKSIERKNECMECRKPVFGVYKIDEEDSKMQGIVKAHEIIQVVMLD